MDSTKTAALSLRIKSYDKHLSDKYVLAATVIVYALYPTITKQLFKLFACSSNLEDGAYYAYNSFDLGIACYQQEHLAYIICLGIPSLIVYIIASLFSH